MWVEWQRHVPAALPPAVTQEAVWASGQVLTGAENLPLSNGIRSSAHPTLSRSTISLSVQY